VRILGIETSCDETAAAVVEDGVTILSSVVASQMRMQNTVAWSELASREHLRAIVPVVRLASEQPTPISTTSPPSPLPKAGLGCPLLVGIT